MIAPHLIALAIAAAALPSFAQPAKPAKGAPTAQDMRLKAARQDPNALCVMLGRQIRKPSTTPAGAAWEEAVAERTAEFGVVPQDQGYIRERRLRVGMHWCGVLAAFGAPDHSNRTVRASGEHHQFVYSNPRRFVYIEENQVRAWQD